jgi:uncharacterized protein involved in response to NO
MSDKEVRIPLPLKGAPRDDAVSRSPVPLAMGFRPFFLVAATFAVVATLVWLHALTAGADPTGGYMALPFWHAHEMLFGFAGAVVAGFLLTAARNWTGLDTAHGWPLLGLVSVWVLGRVLMLGVPVPGALVAASVVAFPLLLAVVVGRVIVRAGRTRNYGIVAVLVALGLAALLVHLEAMGVAKDTARPGLYGALHLIVLLNVVIGGRVIPMFTRNRTKAEGIRKVQAVDRAAIVAAVVVTVAAVAATVSDAVALKWVLGVAGGASGLLQLLRMRTWGTVAALRVPMLAVLHAGYAWIGLGHLLLAASLLWPALPLTVALHALTIGVIGTMTLGMMARVTMGHTGRTIRAPWFLTIAFVAMNLAVAVRLAATVLPANTHKTTWIVSGSLFAAAFLTYGLWALPALLTARPDGKPG